MSESLRERIARALRFDFARRRQPGLTEADIPSLDEFPPGVREMYERQADAALAAIESSGTHVVCPVEPSEAMVQNAGAHKGSQMIARAMYAAMLAVRPRDV